MEQNSNDPNIVVQTLEIEIQNGRQLKLSCLVHQLFHQSVNIGINTRNLAQRLLIKNFVILYVGDKNHKTPNLHKYKMAAI